jgi:phosphoglycolate phosphatase
VKIRAVVFDLDGTLVDTLADIAAAMNRALERLGLPTHPRERYRGWVGHGALDLCRRAAPPEAAGLCERLAGEYRRCYGAAPVVEARPYPGMTALVDRLAADGRALAVLSNKPHELVTAIVAELFPQRFAAVHGHRDGAARKPDPEPARAILRELGVEPPQAAMVGDSTLDIGTARAAGMRAIAVTWGFRPAAELAAASPDACVARPEELLDLL